MSRTGRDRRSSVTGVRALALGATLLLAACGDAPAPGGDQAGTPSTGGNVSSTPQPSTTPPAQPGGTGGVTASGPTDLTVVVDDGSGGTTTWRVTCDPPGGDHPDPAAACRALEQNGATALPPVPSDRMCTQIFGGPEKATVTGTWHGKPVRSTFAKNNGCEIGRWKALAALLPPAGA
jgi:hypothetical protein